MTDKRRPRWLIVMLAFLIGIGVGVGGLLEWLKVERYLERVSIRSNEGSDLMYDLAGEASNYQKNARRLPENARQLIELLPREKLDDLANQAYYQKGKLVWSVRDGVPQPLADGRRVVCWFWNPERKHFVAAIVVREDGALSTEVIPLRSVLQTL